MTRTRIRGYGLAGVGALTKLRRLSLRESPVTDAGLERLRGGPIIDLNLGETAVTDYGMRVLPELAALQALSVRGTKVTNAALAHLAAFGSSATSTCAAPA